MAEWDDARAQWMSTWLLNSTKQKDDKWKKMVAQEENKLEIQLYLLSLACFIYPRLSVSSFFKNNKLL